MLPGTARALYGTATTRNLEHTWQARLPPHTLMQRAGLALARLAMALVPHARTVWMACGPGNNGGDGLEAAVHLQRWGKQPIVTWLGKPGTCPPDTALSWRRAVDAGVVFADEPPARFDLCIDALLGLGAAPAITSFDTSPAPRPTPRLIEGRMAQWIHHINSGTAPVLAVDLPTGLNADTGHGGTVQVSAQCTLSLLTLKPGLFTAQGRDVSGQVWFSALGTDTAETSAPVPSAWLGAAPLRAARLHASHKGSYGDVAVIGGAPGMTGAALLAASAALHAGAGRVLVALLEGGGLAVDVQQPELMFRPLSALDLDSMALVCGCGGGDAVRHALPQVLRAQAALVLDADALNAIASDGGLQDLLRARSTQSQSPRPTVMTPHPLEAARLLGTTIAQVQHHRLEAAQGLADRFGCVVVLKGSGTVIAAPGTVPVINPTGNAKLATAGTGDVLAGMVGARLAADLPAFQAACEAVYRHGQVADDWPTQRHLTAGGLIRAL